MDLIVRARMAKPKGKARALEVILNLKDRLLRVRLALDQMILTMITTMKMMKSQKIESYWLMMIWKMTILKPMKSLTNCIMTNS